MRRTYRDRKSTEYWGARWEELSVDSPAAGEDRYPLLYANAVVGEPEGLLLELGCGPGRLLRYYHAKGVEAIGVDNIAPVVGKLHAFDATLRVACADARALPFANDCFATVLCFGVYHSIEREPSVAIEETFRVLQAGGRLCAEFRADSLHNRIIDLYKGLGKGATAFHKWNYRRDEARAMLVSAGFEIEQEFAALNMTILYHITLLRAASQRVYDQHSARADGYRLRPFVEQLQSLILRAVPNQACNLHIFVCRKPRGEHAS